MGIGKTIKFLRTMKDLKQSNLADQLKVSKNYISLIENDKREPSLSFLNDLAKVLNIPVGLLFLDMDINRNNSSLREQELLMRIRDLIMQIESIRMQSENTNVEV